MPIAPEELASRRELEAKIKSAAHYRRIAQSKGLPCENPDSPAAIRAGSDTPNRRKAFVETRRHRVDTRLDARACPLHARNAFQPGRNP